MRTKNIDRLSKEHTWQDAAGLITKMLGAAGGSQRLYANIDDIPPGAYSTKYHSHTRQEEFFLILSGHGTLRLPDGKQPVGPGDFFAKPAGQGIAHTFYNDGDERLVILDVGTVEAEDTCYYPDEDVYLQKANGQRSAFHGADLDASWSSDPNDKQG